LRRPGVAVGVELGGCVLAGRQDGPDGCFWRGRVGEAGGSAVGAVLARREMLRSGRERACALGSWSRRSAGKKGRREKRKGRERVGGSGLREQGAAGYHGAAARVRVGRAAGLLMGLMGHIAS
jgi:hypothetical protein